MIPLLVAAQLVLSQAAVDRLTPPARYDHEPAVPYKVIDFDRELVWAICGKPAYGCAIGHRIFMDEALSREDYVLILRHEKAHINGWRH